MCEAHNRVNRDLGKEEFRCDMKELDVRWCVVHSSRMPTHRRKALTCAPSLSRHVLSGAMVANGAATVLADGTCVLESGALRFLR